MTSPDVQTIFVVFYAISWGIMSNALPKWKAFHWPFVHKSVRVRLRVVWSFLMLNAAPIALFVIILQKLPGPDATIQVTWWWITLGIIPAGAVFGLYRIWIGVIEIKPALFYYGDRLDMRLARKPWLVDVDPTFDDLNLKPRPNTCWANILWGLAYTVVATLSPWYPELLEFLRMMAASIRAAA